MSLVVLMICLVIVSCEWVEISQQYKKPINPTQNHPVIATPSAIDRNKGNRVYVNQSLEEFNWNKPNGIIESDLVHLKRHGSERRPYDEVKVNGDVNLNRNSGDRRPYDNIKVKGDGNLKRNGGDRPYYEEVKIKGDVLIVRNPKPEVNRKADKGQRVPAAGNVIRVRPVGNTETSTRQKPLEDYKEHNIEVLNLSDAEHTGEDTRLTTPEDEFDKRNRKKNSGNTTPQTTIRYEDKEDGRFTEKPQRTTTITKNEKHPGSIKDGAFITKGNNMRRVEILGNKHIPTRPVKDNDDLRNTQHQFPHTDQTKRVQLHTDHTKSTHKPTSDKNRYSSPELYEEYNFKDTLNQNPNRRIDNTSPPQRVTTQVMPARNIIKSEKTRFENFELITANKNPDELMIEELLNEDIKVHKVAGVSTIDRVYPKEVKNNRRKEGPNRPLTEASIEIDTEKDVFVEDEETINLYDKTLKTNFAASTEEIPILPTAKFKSNKKKVATKIPELSTQVERYENNPYRHVRPSKEPPPEFVTKEEFDDKTGFEEDFSSTENSLNMKVNFGKTTEFPKSTPDPIRNKTNINENPNEKSEEPSNESKTSAMENLIKFLKTVTNIITMNTRRGVQGKMRYLEDLRDTILANIEQRIEAAFPDDEIGTKRRTRSTSEPRGHVEFPSSESALMTISFLTFAVFLIKLVLQVIQAYKNKTMMVVPTMVAAVGRAISDHHHHSTN